MGSRERFIVEMMDGGGINHCFSIYAEKDNPAQALGKVFCSFSDYGVPWGIEKDGISSVRVYRYSDGTSLLTIGQVDE